jgi:EH_Signature domain
MNLLDALNRLGRFGDDLGRGVLITPVDAMTECADLHRMVTALQESQPRRVLEADPVTLEKARRRWKDCRPDISGLHHREIRILCWDLDTALNPAFVRAVEAHEAFRRKRIWIEGLAAAYFAGWRTMGEPERIEQVLRTASRQPCAGKGWLSLCGTHAADIFSAHANAFLARNAFDRKTPVDTELARWSLDGHSQLREATVGAAIEEWLRRYLLPLDNMVDSHAITELKILFEELLPIAGASSAQFNDAVGKVILSKRAGAAGAVQDNIQTWVRKSRRLGDPRDSRNLPKWNLVDPEAVRRFKSWLAKGDLLFFFEFVIPDGQDPHGRKPFWLQYISQVEDSRVVLCAKDRERLQRTSREQFSFGKVTDSFEVSAFVMRFRAKHGEIIVVEFSKSDNRVYIHGAGQFEQNLGSLRSVEFRVDSKRGLKHETYLARFTHYPLGTWQRVVKDYLADKHGIRPQ